MFEDIWNHFQFFGYFHWSSSRKINEHLRHSLFIRRLLLGTCPVQHLQELRRLRPHPAVNVRFRTFYVVVQVVAEHVDQVDGVFPCGALRDMPRKQHKRHVADFVVDRRARVLQLHWGFPMAEEDRGRRVGCPQSLLQLLHEHLPDDDVVFVAETSAEHHGDSVGFRLYIAERCDEEKVSGDFGSHKILKDCNKHKKHPFFTQCGFLELFLVQKPRKVYIH